MNTQTARDTVTEEFFLGEIYKNAKMASSSVIDLLPKVQSEGLRHVMTVQLDGYEGFAARAAAFLQKHGEQPREENIFTRASARVGIAMGTLLDTTESHIAGMMIEGSNMGVTDMTRLLNSFETDHPQSDAVRLAHDLLTFEEKNLERLKKYL